MRAERAVASLLNASTAIASIVQSRIFGSVAPDNSASPLLIYRKQSAARVSALQANQLAVVEARIEVLCVARTYEQLKDLAEAVRLALAYQRGTIAGVDVMHISIESEGSDEYEPQLREHSQAWVYTVTHSE